MTTVHLESDFDHLLDRAHDAGAHVTWDFKPSGSVSIEVEHAGRTVTASGVNLDMAAGRALQLAFPAAPASNLRPR